MRRHRQLLLLTIGYVLLFALASFIFYRRYPGNYRQPNFYAEDGAVFAKNLIHGGFFHALGTTFNGYFLWGIYLTEKVGFILNHLFYGGQFANLPRAFALTSYMFFGLVATLPTLLFRKYLRPSALVIMTALIIFVPMIGWDYAVIGTIGNLKFAFVFIAFMLLVYRHLMPANSKKVYLVDIALLICGYTNITVYFLMVFALLRYLPIPRSKDAIKQLVKDRTFQSLVVLGVALLPQLIVIKLHGVPALPGYLDSPYQFGRTIEIFVSRSYLYGILFPINKVLSDVLVVIISLVILVGSFFAAKKNRLIFWFGLLAVFVTTFTFVIKRTGISAFYPNYHAGGGPDQFFYTQNWIFDFVFSVVIVELISKLRGAGRFFSYLMITLLFGLVLIPHASNYGAPDTIAQNVGTIYAVGKHDCDTQARTFNLTIYPSTSEVYSGVTRQQLCTPVVTNYYPKEVSLGLSPYNNDVLILGNNGLFRQTFTSLQNNLNGLDIFFSTFLTRVHSPYSLTLYSADCKTTIRSVAIQTGKIHDNAFDSIRFPVLADSRNKTYCFTINSTGKGRVDPLAVQLSKAGQYPDGLTVINNQPSDQDIVFDLHYQ